MRRIYYLSTCSTCKRIIDDLGGLKGFEFRDIREKNIEPEMLDTLAAKAGSYEALFSKRALKYKELGLNTKKLTEKDYRKWILAEDTFLKRPVIIADDELFIGNAASEVARAKSWITKWR
jgi:arsenate reductase-like glutaredoxin family protein